MPNETWHSYRIVLWWRWPGGYVPFIGTLGIFRLMQRVGERDTVIFECKMPQAEHFVYTADMHSVVEVKYVDVGRTDNPAVGETLFYIKNIEPLQRWINHLSSVEYVNHPIKMYLHAKCDIDVVDREGVASVP